LRLECLESRQLLAAGAFHFDFGLPLLAEVAGVAVAADLSHWPGWSAVAAAQPSVGSAFPFTGLSALPTVPRQFMAADPFRFDFGLPLLAGAADVAAAELSYGFGWAAAPGVWPGVDSAIPFTGLSALPAAPSSPAPPAALPAPASVAAPHVVTPAPTASPAANATPHVVTPAPTASPAANATPYVVTVTPPASPAANATPNVATVVGAASAAGTAAPVVVSPAGTSGGGTTATAGMSMGGPSTTMNGVYLPTCCANPTVVSVKSGLWSDPTTWSTGKVPAAGDVVSVAGQTTVTYDAISDAALDCVVIQSGGTLTFRTDANTRLTVGTMAILDGGSLLVGTTANPVAPNVTADIVIADEAIDLSTDPSSVGTGILGWGAVHMHGATKDSFIKLASQPSAGDTTLQLAQVPNGWQVGDRLVLPDSRDVYGGVDVPFNQMEWETPVIKAISGTTVTLTAPLLYDHPGARDASGALRFLPYVADMTRNVIVRSANPSGTRGHILMTGRADVDIEYVWMKDLGRTLNSQMVDTTEFDANGNPTSFAQNQIGRYPLHMHHLAGPTTPQPDGYQFTIVGDSVDGGDTPNDHKWGIDVHASSYGLIEDNVVYNTSGAGISTEDGSEVNNLFEHNYVVRTDGLGRTSYDRIAAGRPVVDFGHAGDGYWFQGPSNVARDNVAADSRQSGFDYYSSEFGMQVFPVPLYQGADPMTPGQYKNVINGEMPFGGFSNNESFTAAVSGLFTRFSFGTGSATVFDGLKTWNSQSGYFNESTPTPVSLTNPVVIGDAARAAMFDPWNPSYGLNVQGPAVGMSVQGADIENVGVGVIAPTHTSMPPSWAVDQLLATGQPVTFDSPFQVSDPNLSGTFAVQDSRFRNNLTDVQVDNGSPSTDQWSIYDNRQVIIRNDSFSHTGATGYNAISTGLKDWTGGAVGWDYRKLQQVLVYGFDGNPNDNFQVFFPQQAPGYVMPQTQYTVLGSPVAGLTNQQNWDQYGIATGGQVTPSDAVARAEIVGSVAPIRTPTPGDTTPPVVSAVAVSAMSATGTVTISWHTDKPTNTQLFYGAYANGVVQGGMHFVSTPPPAFTTDHQVTVTGLDPHGVYKYSIVARDAADNHTVSSGFVGDITPPVVSDINVTLPSLTSASITWATDEPSSTSVEYGLTSSYGTTVYGGGGVTDHTVTFGNLQPFTTYHYRVISQDPSGNQTVTEDRTFQTGSMAGVVKTTDPGYSETGRADWWWSSQDWWTQDTSRHFMSWDPSGQSEGTATWSFGDLPAGVYQVYTTWIQGWDSSGNVPYTISDGQGAIGSVVVNQHDGLDAFWYQGQPFALLGQFTSRGGPLSVTIQDNQYLNMVTAGTTILVQVG
jgi:hypothetical protein